MKALTFNQIINAIQEYNYIILRDVWGNELGYNCKVALLSLNRAKWKSKKRIRNMEEVSNYCSFRPCGLMEYINHKISY